MKTATVTWITYNNFGTLLQAYALQKQLEQLDHDNVIISDQEILKDYKATKPTAEKNAKTKQDGSQSKNRLTRLFRLLSNPRRLSRVIMARTDRERYELPYYATQDACEKFKREELNILKGETVQTLPDLNDRFDVFICGSDQIWSVLESNFNPYYYLNFVTTRKIAYAPCLGTDRIPEKTAQTIKTLLSGYTAVSVRESISAKQLSDLTGRDVAWVADPTLLYDRQFWSEFTSDTAVRKGKYLLCYFLENNTWYFKYAHALARQLRLNIILIPNKWDYLSDEYVVKDGVGPKEFVSLIQHASYVLTDSYHGSIFSLIFEKNFQYLLRFIEDDPQSQNIRIHSLFDFLGLGDRIVNADMCSKPKLEIDNYGEIKNKLHSFRESSLEFLRSGLLDISTVEEE